VKVVTGQVRHAKRQGIKVYS